jgi:hypothetical protein
VPDYRDELLRIKAERTNVRYREVAEDILHHDRERLEAEQAAKDALARGDSDTARWYVENAEQAERSIASLSTELDQLDASGQRQGGLSEAKREFIEQHPEFQRRLVNDSAFAKAAGDAHQYLISRGYRDDSPEYLQMMKDAAELYGNVDMTPVLTPDEACELASKKFALKPEEYNRNVEKLEAIKRTSPSQYPDKG